MQLKWRVDVRYTGRNYKNEVKDPGINTGVRGGNEKVRLLLGLKNEIHSLSPVSIVLVFRVDLQQYNIDILRL